MARESYNPVNHSAGSAFATEVAEGSRSGFRGVLRGVLIGALVPAALGVGAALLFGGGAIAATVLGIGGLLLGGATGALYGGVLGGIIGTASGFDRGENRVNNERAAALAQTAYDRQRSGLESVVQAQMADAQSRMALAEAMMAQAQGASAPQMSALSDVPSEPAHPPVASPEHKHAAHTSHEHAAHTHASHEVAGGHADVSAAIPHARSEIEVPDTKVSAASIDPAMVAAMQAAPVEHGKGA